MITREELAGNWNRLKGRIRETWGQITDDDLQKGQGSVEQLVGTIQEKTGVARREIEQFVTGVVREASSMTDQLAQGAREYAHSAADAIQDGYSAAQKKTEELSRQVAQTVSYRPLESLAIAFGVGIAAGLLLAMNRRSA
jgi:uncharacterized protein YjbJ (UPF0337 family)